jgi:hypothetical protein
MRHTKLPLAAAILLAGCASWLAEGEPPGPRSAESDMCLRASVQMLGQARLAEADAPDGVPIGGISAITHDQANGGFLVITDGRGQPGAGRIGRLNIRQAAGDDFAAEWLGSAELLTATGHPFARPSEGGEVADAEGLRMAADGALIWSSEGDAARGQGPGLYRLVRGDWRSHAIPLPAELVRDPDRRRGPRDNQSLEGLWIDADDNIWLGIEAPLIEDGPVPDQTTGALTRILRIDRDGVLGETWNYPLDPVVGKLPGRIADNGLTEILGLGRRAFLVLERSGVQQQDGRFSFTSRLYCASPSPGSRVLAKRELATFDHSNGWQDANFEGMTFGPALPDGRTMLVLASDNNFEAGAPSRFAILAFRR